MSQRDLRELIEFFQDFGFLIALAVVAIIALVIGLILRKPADKKAGAKGRGKGDKEEFYKDTGKVEDPGTGKFYKDTEKVVDPGTGKTWEDDGLDQLDDGETEYYKDKM